VTASPTSSDPAARRHPRRLLLLIYAILSLGIVGAGVALHASTRAGARHRGGVAIDTVAAMRVEGVESWRAAALDDVRAASRYEEVMEAAERADDLGEIFRFEAERVMGDLAHDRGLVRVAIVTEDGRTVVGVTGTGKPGPEPDLALVRRALAEGPSTSLVAPSAEKRPRLDLAAAIPASGPHRCVLYAQLDASAALAEVVGGWPVPSETGETVLVRRDGDAAIFVTDPRFLTGWAFEKRIPLDERSRGIVLALEGEGVREGTDHRGTRILTSTRPLPGSDLLVVARMDLEEIEAPIVGPVNQLSLLVLFLLAAGAAGLAYVQRAERRHERALAVARRDLETSQERLKLALEGTHWVWDWDLEAGTFAADPGWARSVELPEHTLQGTFDDILARIAHPDDRPLAAARFEALVRGETPRLETEFRARLPVGERWIRFRAGATDRGPDGAARRLSGVLSDVTDQRNLQGQLERSERMASLGTLAAGVAHEINNPLTYVVANLEAIERSAGPDRADLLDTVRQAREGVERVREVVRGLRSFSRGGTSRGPVDVGEELEAAIRIARNELQHRATLDIRIDRMPAVDARGRELGQVFLNLLVNAGQAIPEGSETPGRVRVRAGTDDEGRARVEIADDGVGIPPEVLPRIFEPFFTTKPLGVGTGLGLAIAHNVVTGAGGTIEVQSQLGAGTTFRVLLPAARARPAPRVAETPVPQAPAGRDGRQPVLVVDDEPLVARSIARALQPEHAVVLSTSAEEARGRIEGGARFAAVVCDLMMPGMTGMDLYDWVTVRDPELAGRFVFVTGGAFTQRARTFLERTPVACVDKPFEPERLREAVRAAAGRAAVA
jgi:signal transduction histidine kinase/CheY-like chemotaxis protein